MGGSGTPAANYPEHVLSHHIDYMNDMDIYLETALLAGSPYQSIVAYDPNPDLDATDSRYDLFTDEVDALNPETDWQALMDKARTYWTTNFGGATPLQVAVDAIEKRETETLMRSAGRLANGLSAINSVQSSTFLTSMAILERGFSHDVNDATAKLQLQFEQNKLAFVLQSTGDMMRFFTTRLDALRLAYASKADNSRIRILANREWIAEDANYAAQDATWEMSLFQYPANLISGLSGAALIPKGQNPMGSALSGALTGASIGAAGFQMGGQVGAITTIAGALLGGIGNYLNAV
jgi:hypothetical protein